MDGGQDWDGLLGGINTSENVGSLKNSGETLVDGLWGQVVQVQVDVIAFGANTTSLEDFHGHGAGDNITGGEILSSRGVSLHETFSVLVSEDTTLTTATFSYEATSTINTGRVELNELGVLDREAGSSNHTTTVTSAGVGGGAALVGSTVPTGGEHSLVGTHTMDGSVSDVIGHNSSAFAILHDKVHSEVFNEENTVVTKGTTEKCVQHRVTSSVSDSTASVCLTTLTVLSGLTTKGSLVDLALSGSTEGHTVGLELTNGDRGLTGHVLDSVLISEPVTTLDGVVEMPLPGVLVHVAESSVNTTL